MKESGEVFESGKLMNELFSVEKERSGKFLYKMSSGRFLIQVLLLDSIMDSSLHPFSVGSVSILQQLGDLFTSLYNFRSLDFL